MRKKDRITLFFVTLIIFASFLGVGFALPDHPNPEVDVGRVVPITAWCKKVEDVVPLVIAREQEDLAPYLKMVTKTSKVSGGSSCVDIRVMRSVLRSPSIPIPHMKILRIVDKVEIRDGKWIAIAALSWQGAEVYSWHAWEDEES